MGKTKHLFRHLTAAKAPPKPTTADEDPSERPKSRLTEHECFLFHRVKKLRWVIEKVEFVNL